MLAEYAILPDVFDPAGYASAEACDRQLRLLKECVLSQAVVRDLHDGGWSSFMEQNRGRWHLMGKELLKKLKKQCRLTTSTKCAAQMPDTSAEWCAEALASHQDTPLDGIVADDATDDAYVEQPLVAPIGNVAEANWWRGGRNSIQLKRTMGEYLEVLDVTLRHSNSLMFIDPHLDPTRPSYSEFSKLIGACGKRDTTLQIEIHRACYVGTGQQRQIVANDEWERRFGGALRDAAREINARLEVFIWDDFHDRYLISNLIGILLPNGFDVEANPSTTRWARLDREHADSVQREFHPNSRLEGRNLHRFVVRG